MNTVVVGELLAGFSAGSREAVNRTELAEFLDCAIEGLRLITRPEDLLP